MAESLARALEADPEPARLQTGVQVRQQAASNLRELIRALIPLRAHRVEGLEQPLRVVEELPGLTPAERALMRGRLEALMARVAESATPPSPRLPPASSGADEARARVPPPPGIDALDDRPTVRPGAAPNGAGPATAVSPAAPNGAIAAWGAPAAAPNGAVAAAPASPAAAPSGGAPPAAPPLPIAAPPLAAAEAALAAALPAKVAAGRTGRTGRGIPMASVLQALAGKAIEYLGADLCQVFLGEEDVLTLRAETPASAEPAGPARLSPHAGFTRRVLEGGVAAIVVGREGLDGTEAIWHDRGLRSLAAVGMGSADSRSGLLVVGRTEAWPFDPDELSTLQNLAVETSLALASADLVSRAEELAVLGERLKLAREIHDGLASDLSAVVALFKYHEQRRETDPEEAERLLQQMRGLVEDALRGARDILATLRPRQRVEGTLPEAVRRLADEFSRTYGVTAVISVLGGDEELIEEERDTIYQVLREALTNVRKHAAAAAIEVRLDLRGRPFVLTVDDDGVGIDVDNLGRKPGSFGITGMRERAELIGAWVEISPRPQGGTRVMLRGAGPTA